MDSWLECQYYTLWYETLYCRMYLKLMNGASAGGVTIRTKRGSVFVATVTLPHMTVDSTDTIKMLDPISVSQNHPGVLELLAPAPLEGSRDKTSMSCGKTSSLLMVSTLMLYFLEYLSHCIRINNNWTQLLSSVFRTFRLWHCWFVSHTVELVMVCASICMISSLLVIPGCDGTYRFL